ncbi:uncharacterized protein C4orf54 homolog [Mixophyes fleayi]|uniref:uncharacterized protein C4orf54 homolog n=1 Tax=Mixophyes fleayi TaxID=3061075 RepID=UPI003F4D968E
MQQAVSEYRASSECLKKVTQPDQEPKYVEIPFSAEKRGASKAGVTVTVSALTLGRTEDMQEDEITGYDCKQTSVGAQKFSWTAEQNSGDHLGSPAMVSKVPGELPNKGGKGELEERSEGTVFYPSSRASESDPPITVDMPHQGCANDEAHYITTHEIQLCEADQDPDYPDFGLAPSTWSEPVDSAPCTFLEYASFDSQGGTPTDEDCSYYLSTASDPNPTDSLGSTELVSTYSESDTSPISSRSSTRLASPDESKAGNPAGQILLSIKTASKAINDPSNIQAKQNTAPADAKHEIDMSYCVSRATESKSAFRQQQQHHCYPHPQATDAHRLVAIPARLQARSGVHADISSGASSAVSELDDADKEVRNLTSRAFRSLAYPYFEAINFSSSESTTSLSDQNIGINSWSTYLDWKGASFLSQKAEQTLHQHSTTTSNFGLKKIGKDASKEQVYVQANKSETKAFELVVSEVAAEKKAHPACASKHIQSGSRVVTLTETLNFSSNVKANAAGNERASKPPDHAPGSVCTDGVTEALPREPVTHEVSKLTSTVAEAMEGTHKSKIASSLLKNVISKKMQREQEFKMERGEITDTSQKVVANSSKETEESKDKGIQRQNSKFSETGSDFTLVSSEDLGEFFDVKSGTPKDFTAVDGNTNKQMSSLESHREEAICEMKKSASETMKGIFLRSQNSAFRSWKEKEIEKMEKKIEETVAKARKIKIPLERDWKADLEELSTVKSTKMSRLYVPGIQHTPKEKQVEKQATKYSVSTYAHQSCLSRNDNDFKSEKLHILQASASRMTPRVTPKPQEIKLNLGLSSQNKDSPFNIAKLLTPNLASSAAILSKAAEDLRNQIPSRAEVLEKMPQFLVRDVRETKPKVQGTMHQVRDVRKLLKSSYSQDAGDSDRGSVMSDHSATDQKSKVSGASKTSSSLSPIVITCQAVKSKEDGENDEMDILLEREKGLSAAETVLVHRASGRLPVATIAPNKTGPRMPVVKIVSKASKWKQEKPKDPEIKPEPKSPQSRAALEKLTAAVKTMEQLYVFDRKEWKRKDEPSLLAGSHVLSLIACEEASGERKLVPAEEVKTGAAMIEDPRKAIFPRVSKAPEPLGRRNSHPSLEKTPQKPPAIENKVPPRTFQVSRFREGKKQGQPDKNLPNRGTSNVNVFTVSAAPTKSKQESLESALNTKNKRPQPPTSLKIPQIFTEEPKKAESAAPQPPSLVRKASADFENYLTIPVKVAGEGKPPLTSSVREPPPNNKEVTTSSRETSGNARETNVNTRENTSNTLENTANLRGPSSIIREAAATIRDSTAVGTLPIFSSKTLATSPKSPIKLPNDWRSKVKEGVQPTRAASAGSEPQTPDSVPPATIYHHPLPPMAMAMPSTQGPIYYSPPLQSAAPAEMYPQTQRKMLVDLATGQYYLVDTPVQPIKRRLFDPETGQYVDVPVPPPPVTPVPFHMPQLALSPGAYGPAYMFYPGFLPTASTAVLPPNTMQTQLSNPGSEHTYEMPVVEGSLAGDLGYSESPYYLATGTAAASTSTGQSTNIRRGSLGCTDGKQVISILSQPGPRIVAPPSFDGTTMRFVVEHR